MFIERLSEKEIRKFLNDNIKMEIVDFKKVNDQFYVKFDCDVEYIFNDFECQGLTIFAKAGQDIVEEKWVDFMASNFRKEYNYARLDHEGVNYTTL